MSAASHYVWLTVLDTSFTIKPLLSFKPNCKIIFRDESLHPETVHASYWVYDWVISYQLFLFFNLVVLRPGSERNGLKCEKNMDIKPWGFIGIQGYIGTSSSLLELDVPNKVPLCGTHSSESSILSSIIVLIPVSDITWFRRTSRITRDVN